MVIFHRIATLNYQKVPILGDIGRYPSFAPAAMHPSGNIRRNVLLTIGAPTQQRHRGGRVVGARWLAGHQAPLQIGFDAVDLSFMRLSASCRFYVIGCKWKSPRRTSLEEISSCDQNHQKTKLEPQSPRSPSPSITMCSQECSFAVGHGKARRHLWWNAWNVIAQGMVVTTGQCTL